MIVEYVVVLAIVNALTMNMESHQIVMVFVVEMLSSMIVEYAMEEI